jgi:hypothetical protein
MKKNFLAGFAVVFLLFQFVAVSAITASLGGSRMILRPEVGEIVERSLLIKNVNDVPITIDFYPTGDLVENLELEDDQIELDPGEEAKVYFTIYTDLPGSFETKINVRFGAEDSEAVGLTSTVIIIAKDSDNEIEERDEEELSIKEEETNSHIFNSGEVPVKISVEEDSSLNKMLLTLTVVLAVVFIALLLYASKFGKKSVGGKGAKEG